MEWRAHFNSTFFSVWKDRGLPDPSGYVTRYEEFFSTVDLPAPLIKSETNNSDTPVKAISRDVYRFGVFYGHAVGRLLVLPEAEIDRRADWCGRFNLGISLFDYIIDEEGRAEYLLRWKPFNRLLSGAGATFLPSDTDEPLSSAERLLREISTDVLTRLEAEVGSVEQQQRPDGMWRSLSEMIRAEMSMSQTELTENPEVAALLDDAMIKSAGPFRCMAEWMTVGTSRHGFSRESAAALGAAIGNCYWLADDAKDLWVDLDARRWNLFLLTAAKTKPDLFGECFDAASEVRLSNIILRRGWVEGIVTPMIERFQMELTRTPAQHDVRNEVAGMIAVSIERWLR